jgi:putative Mg2+ transporter-C (MgtC) family protein
MELSELLDVALWSRVGAALLCGGVIGFERQLRGRPAGVRTSSLICLGTAMFVYLGMTLRTESGGDATRVLGQVVTGVGFLGGGVIMTRDGLVTGVTSAAVVWVLAAVGAAIGAGKFSFAIVVSFVTVTVLVGVEKLELAFAQLRRGVHAAKPSLTLDSSPTQEHTKLPLHRPRHSGAPPYRPRK